MTCADRSTPQSPIRLNIEPQTSPSVDTKTLSAYRQKIDTPIARHPSSQLRNQRPARTGPIFLITHGPIHVARTSRVTETVLIAAIWAEVYPLANRYVT